MGNVIKVHAQFILLSFLMAMALIMYNVKIVNAGSTLSLPIISEGIKGIGGTTVEFDYKDDKLLFDIGVSNSEVQDGTAPYDSNNESGNDNNNHNKIVRSFDTITYPLKMTLNPRGIDGYTDIKIKIRGELENGYYNDRLQATFGIGNIEDSTKVRFEQEYTMNRTGNSIMIPIMVNVEGAMDGVRLKPNIRVTIESIEGNRLPAPVEVYLGDIEDVVVSSKVSIQPLLRLGHNSSLTYPADRFDPSIELGTHKVHLMSTGISVKPLQGKNTLKGATFPVGKIDMKMVSYGEVLWEDGDKQIKETLDYSKGVNRSKIFDIQPISTTTTRVGVGNGQIEGKKYTQPAPLMFLSGISKMDYTNSKILEKENYRSVWDSGKWSIQPAVEEKKLQTEQVISIEDYVVGNTFPEYRSDGYIGGKYYTNLQKVIATQGIIMLENNEYRLGGKMNKEKRKNNVYYRYKNEIVGYEDENGNYVKYADSGATSIVVQERNTGRGAFSVNNTFFDSNGGTLPGYQVGNATVSTGVPAVMRGENAMIVGYMFTQGINQGGVDYIVRFNTDSFYLSKEQAESAKSRMESAGYLGEDQLRKKIGMKMEYGVPEFTDNKFDNFIEQTRNNYSWYDNYDEAVQDGQVGAVKVVINNPTGTGVVYSSRIPITVITGKSGTVNDKGTPNITVTDGYIYLDKEREVEYELEGRVGKVKPTMFDEQGEITLQEPRGSGVPMETLTILDAEMSVNITSNKLNYYLSEQVQWETTVDNKIPEGSIDLDRKMKLTHELPEGIDYVEGSGKVDGENYIPRIQVNKNGTRTLEWDLLLTSKYKVPKVTFNTFFTPSMKVTGASVSKTVTGKVDTVLDNRREDLRTGKADINVLSVGMVGVYEYTPKQYGGIGEDMVVVVNPYTTIDRENNVVGIKHVPVNGDSNGSKFAGEIYFKDVAVKGIDPSRVKLYLNNTKIDRDDPQNINTEEDGWYAYEVGKPFNKEYIKSMYFTIDGELTNNDKVELYFTFELVNNKFGDEYYTNTIVNTDRNYRVSSESNKTKYSVKPSVEVELNYVEIVTNKYTKGLTMGIDIAHDIYRADYEGTEEVILEVIDMRSNTQVATKTYTINTLPVDREEIILPVQERDIGEEIPYTIQLKISTVNGVTHLRDGKDKITTKGYVSNEKEITLDYMNKGGAYYDETKDIYVIKYPVVTRKYIGEDVRVGYEELSILPTMYTGNTTGYGLYVSQTLRYLSGLGNTISNLTPQLQLPTEIVSETVGYGGNIPLEPTLDISTTEQELVYSVPRVWVQTYTGKVITHSEYNKLPTLNKGEYVSGGRNVYLPVWLDHSQDYAYMVVLGDVGIHGYTIKIKNNIGVERYMLTRVGTPTITKDRILIKPVDTKRK